MIFSLYKLIVYKEYYNEEKLIQKYYIEEQNIINKEENNKENVKESNNSKKENNNSYYIGILEIPKIKFKKGFVNINHKDNNVDKNIQILEGSTFPDVENHLLVIAGHSGNSKKSFFKNLYKLELNDIAYINYSGYTYTYQIIKIENVDKDGTIEIAKANHSMLVLTTCNQVDKTKQIVIYATLVDKKITT